MQNNMYDLNIQTNPTKNITFNKIIFVRKDRCKSIQRHISQQLYCTINVHAQNRNVQRLSVR